MNNNNELSIKITDVIDLDFLQKFQDKFSQAFGVASITVDLDGNGITNPSNFRRFCMDLVRESPLGNERCINCDKNAGEQASKNGKPYIYRCHAGLVDFAAPIMLNGKQIGSILGGQVLTKPINEDEVIDIAHELSINEKELVKSVKDVAILEEDKIKYAAELLYLVAGTISETGYNRFKLNEVINDMTENIKHITDSIVTISESSKHVTSNQTLLNEDINTISDESKKIIGFVDFTKKIAFKSNFLGVNASIEAARAGVMGVDN